MPLNRRFLNQGPRLNKRSPYSTHNLTIYKGQHQPDHRPMRTNHPALISLALVCFTTLAFAQHKPLRLWYDKPAQRWEETLPLGNGHLGMMPDGDVANEKIVLN